MTSHWKQNYKLDFDVVFVPVCCAPTEEDLRSYLERQNLGECTVWQFMNDLEDWACFKNTVERDIWLDHLQLQE